MDIDEFRRQFGIRVQALRKARKLSQEQLAEAIERSTDTVSNIERGVGSPSIETAFRMAEALGLSLVELFDIGPGRPLDRERRQLVDRLVEKLGREDRDTLEAINAQVDILLRVKAGSAGRPPRR